MTIFVEVDLELLRAAHTGARDVLSVSLCIISPLVTEMLGHRPVLLDSCYDSCSFHYFSHIRQACSKAGVRGFFAALLAGWTEQKLL